MDLGPPVGWCLPGETMWGPTGVSWISQVWIHYREQGVRKWAYHLLLVFCGRVSPEAKQMLVCAVRFVEVWASLRYSVTGYKRDQGSGLENTKGEKDKSFCGQFSTRMHTPIPILSIVFLHYSQHNNYCYSHITILFIPYLYYMTAENLILLILWNVRFIPQEILQTICH